MYDESSCFRKTLASVVIVFIIIFIATGAEGADWRTYECSKQYYLKCFFDADSIIILGDGSIRFWTKLECFDREKCGGLQTQMDLTEIYCQTRQYRDLYVKTTRYDENPPFEENKDGSWKYLSPDGGGFEKLFNFLCENVRK